MHVWMGKDRCFSLFFLDSLKHRSLTVHRCTSAEKAWLSDAAAKLGKAMPAETGEVKAAKAPAAAPAPQVEQAQLLFGFKCFKGRTRIYVLYIYNYIYMSWYLN